MMQAANVGETAVQPRNPRQCVGQKARATGAYFACGECFARVTSVTLAEKHHGYSVIRMALKLKHG